MVIISWVKRLFSITITSHLALLKEKKEKIKSQVNRMSKIALLITQMTAEKFVHPYVAFAPSEERCRRKIMDKLEVHIYAV
ncbi:LOW QUALITY PROTEIN: hypothetical protein PHMEG_0003011 [Phytophthora megakarya]|uniref:Uncharacterized protein n=1 Tax=Phytophthora megakarya TaxID=4795 RepID=A0A225WZ66_9STRA|nr:LOW QUALITY PROTEIN: hypothetical protein PHMEG_0003011 [Phytophthora megakarya]